VDVPDDRGANVTLHDIENMRLQYEASQDQWLLWVAYRACREGGLSIPEWILSVFDQISDRLSFSFLRRDPTWRAEIEANRGLSIPPDDRQWQTVIADVFGFKPSTMGGQSDPFRLWEKAFRDCGLAASVRDLVNDGHNVTDACYLVATDNGVSHSSVKRAWSQWREAVLHAAQAPGAPPEPAV
jgi:hypothetical protein